MRRLHIVVDKQAAKGSKYKLLVDRHFGALHQELLKMGYDVEIVPEFGSVDQSLSKNLKDFETHKYLCSFRKEKKIKEKPIIFITNDYDDFQKIRKPFPAYHTFAIKTQKLTIEKLANKIQEELRNPNNVFSDGYATPIYFDTGENK